MKIHAYFWLFCSQTGEHANNKAVKTVALYQKWRRYLNSAKQLVLCPYKTCICAYQQFGTHAPMLLFGDDDLHIYFESLTSD